MALTSTRSGRFQRMVVSVLLLVMFAGSNVHLQKATASKAMQNDDSTLDLAAMVLTPADIVAEGIDGAGLASIDWLASHWSTLGEVVNGSVAGRETDDRPAADRLVFDISSTGWQRQYHRVMGQLRSDGSDIIELGIYSDVAEYANAEGADKALTLLTDGGVSESGDDSVGERMEIRRDDDISIASILVVAFRVDNLIGSVEIVRFQGREEPEVALGVALARRLEERIANGRSEDRNSLADITLRLALPANPPEYEGYYYLGQELMTLWGETEADQRARVASYGAAIDVYQVRQFGAPGHELMDPPRFMSRLHRFPDESAAIEWMETVPRQVEQEIAASKSFEAEEVSDATTLGDESLTYAFDVQRNVSSASGYRIYVRVGAVVARVQYDATIAPPLAAVEALAGAQIACLTSNACPEFGARPIGLEGSYCPQSSESSRPGTDISAIGFEPVVVPVSGGDSGRTGANPGPGPEGVPEVIWQFAAAGDAQDSPVVSDGVVFVGVYDGMPRRDIGNLFAVDAGTGAQRWCVTTGTASRPTPIVAGDLVIVGVGSLPWSPDAYGLAESTRFVVALDEESGSERWRFSPGGYSSGSTTANETVFVATNEGGLWALDAETGDILWLYQADPGDGGDGALFGAPAVADGVVYVTGDGLLHAVDAETGESRWQVEVGGEEFLGRPIVSGETVYLIGGERAYAVEVESGEELWRFVAERIGWLSAVDGVVYLGAGPASEQDDAALLYALDAASGEEQWQFEAEGAIAKPAVVGDVVYIATTVETGDGVTEGRIHAIETANGQGLWIHSVDGSPSGPTVVGGRILVSIEPSGQPANGQSVVLLAIGGED